MLIVAGGRGSDVVQEGLAIGRIGNHGDLNGFGIAVAVLIGHGELDGRGPALIPFCLEHDDRILGVVEDIDAVDRDVVVRLLRVPGPARLGRTGSADFFSNVEAFDQLSEYGMIEVEEASWDLGDEKLRVVRIVARLGKRQHALAIVLQVGMKIIVKVAEGRSAGTGSGGVTTLDHEVIGDPMKNDPVIEIGIGQIDDTARRGRSTLFKELEHHVAVSIHVNANGRSR